MRNLIVSGGIFHDFDTAAAALGQALAEVRIESELVGDFDTAMSKLRTGDYQLLTVYALRWRMLDHPKYEPYRAQWALHLSDAHRAVLKATVQAGTGLLGLHTAAICFDDWPEWRVMLGASWVWGQTFHPPCGEVQVRPARHELTKDCTPFVLRDELYHQLSFEPGVTPLLEAALPNGDQWHQVAWAHRYGAGRVVGDSLGHDADSVNQPQHRRFLQRAALWATRQSDGAIA